MAKNGQDNEQLPGCVSEYISLVIRKMGYRRKVRQEVRRELTDHFADALGDCQSDAERDKLARALIEKFGDAKVLGKLIRRGKKRCRPMWKKVMIRSFQGLGVFVVLFGFYSWWFFSGRPTIRIDYVTRLNDIFRPEVKIGENAWPNYERAIELYVEPNKTIIEDLYKKTGWWNQPRISFTDLEDGEKSEWGKWIADNEAAWGEVAAAGKKEYCYKRYEMKDKKEPLVSMLLPNLIPLRELAKMGIWRARMEIDAGQKNEALNDCTRVARIGRHWQGRGVLIEQLVGMGICSLAHREILHIVGSKDVTAEELKRLQQQLAGIYRGGYPLMNIEGERIWFLDVVQHVFTDGGPGGGHIIPGSMEYFGGGYSHPIFFLMGHARRTKTIKKGNEVYDRISVMMKMSPYERKANDANEDIILSELAKHKYYFIHMFIPAMSRASDIDYRGKALDEAVVTVLALKRWGLEKGGYPESLQELVDGGYLQEQPGDPYSDGILRYEKRGDDFVLYSVGADFDDDGGVENPDASWGEEGGDRVFWPIDAALQ